MRATQRSGGRRQRPAGIRVGQLGDGQRVEQLNVAQPAAAVLQVGFGAVRDLAAALPAGLRSARRVRRTRGGFRCATAGARRRSAAPTARRRRRCGALRASPAPPRCPRWRPSAPRARCGRCGRAECWRPTADTTASSATWRDDVGGHVVVHQRQVEVGVRQQLAAARGHRWRRWRSRWSAVMPISAALVVSQNSCRSSSASRSAAESSWRDRRSAVARAAVGQIGLAGRRRARRRRLPSGGAGGGIWCLLCHLVLPGRLWLVTHSVHGRESDAQITLCIKGRRSPARRCEPAPRCRPG